MAPSALKSRPGTRVKETVSYLAEVRVTESDGKRDRRTTKAECGTLQMGQGRGLAHAQMDACLGRQI
jgi:hypothetical protein